MKIFVFLILFLSELSFCSSQNILINPVIKTQNEIHYVRSGRFIYEIDESEVKYFAFGLLSTDVHYHNSSLFLNFDIKDSLLVTFEYVNNKINQTLNPNRFNLVLKHPSFGDPKWALDVAKFDIGSYLPKNLGNFYCDLSIIDSGIINLYLLQNQTLYLYEILFNDDLAGIKSVKCLRKLETNFEGYFNIIHKPNNEEFLLFKDGFYSEFKENNLKSSGNYSDEYLLSMILVRSQ